MREGHGLERDQMIPIEIENRIAKYFFHMYLPEEIRIEVEYCLLEICDHFDENELNHDELVLQAIRVIDDFIEWENQITIVAME